MNCICCMRCLVAVGRWRAARRKEVCERCVMDGVVCGCACREPAGVSVRARQGLGLQEVHSPRLSHGRGERTSSGRQTDHLLRGTYPIHSDPLPLPLLPFSPTSISSLFSSLLFSSLHFALRHSFFALRILAHSSSSFLAASYFYFYFSFTFTL